MKMRIRNKILLTVCSLILVSLVSQIVFNQFLSKSFFMKQQKGIIADAFEQIKNGYGDNLDTVNDFAEKLRDTYGIKTVVTENGETVYSSGYSFMPKGEHPGKNHDSEPDMNPGGNPALRNSDFTTAPEVKFIEGKRMLNETDRLQLAGKFYRDGKEVLVLLTLQIAAIDNSISVFTESNIYISAAVLVIGVLIALLVCRSISKPITAIESVSEKIAELDFSHCANESESTVELASLARSINKMSSRLERNMAELTAANEQLQKDIEYKNKIDGYRKEFIAAVSHEMKTPLALLQIYTENLKNSIEGIDRDFYCSTILDETEKLNKMISSMLEISSVDSGFIKLNFEQVDFSALCADILHKYSPLLHNYKVSTVLADNAVVSGDVKYLEQVIKNILNNAMQHTAAGKEIRITVTELGGKVSFSVYNLGEHIPESDLEHLWDAFYRTDKARTHNEKNNVGLGLYIVKTIVDKHGGTCCIENVPGGVTVTVTI